MSPAPLLALLGVTFTLHRVQALTCEKGILNSVYDAAELPLKWTAGEEDCEGGWGCQDTLIHIQNGPQVNVVITKGCTLAEEQEGRITEHRAGPGLSIISYTRVCRNANKCNDLSNSTQLWALSSRAAPAPRGVQCPTCLSTDECPEKGTELACPAGLTHCYSGNVVLNGGGITATLRVQGCMAQAGCNLLNGTQEIGPISVSENCNSKDFLVCQSGNMLRFGQYKPREPIEWTSSGNRMCAAGEVCQETLLLMDAGHKLLLLGSKGCASPGTKESRAISIHSGPPGVLVASYFHVCSSNGCNRADSSSVLANNLPLPAAPDPEGLRCPACVNFFGTCSDPKVITCPMGTTHCYKGYIKFRGGGFSSTADVQGCMAQHSKSLLNNTRNIGTFSVTEYFDEEPLPQDGVAPACCLAWMVGLGLSLAFWCGGFCLPY
ncbi:CD177 antigen [Elephas maximus indicus]|uniref:CD177 antigen n=1 Tax=Elephas maximus indicus TaxID=99487 RepID=UPI00211603B8|nr:CD177 antigen [Elephas maximus indicus]